MCQKYIIYLVGLGMFMNKESVEKMTDLVRAALDNGYRHIDTAILYGNSNQLG